MRGFGARERHLIAGMGLMSGLRTLGVSMSLPVFSYYAMHLPGATERAVGIAVGVFGISQTLFQIPMGSLSDHWGRKRVMMLGSLVFIFGLVLCGLASNIYVLAVARFIAGVGAVSGVAMTWITDGVKAERRNRAVAYLGACIGAAVTAGFPLGWVIAGRWGAESVFYTAAVFCFVAVAYAFLFVEEEAAKTGDVGKPYCTMARCMREMARHPDMMRLIVSGFIGSVCCSGVFYMLPILIAREMHVDHMWKIFAPAACIGTALMYYFSGKANAWGTVRIAQIGFALELAGVALPVASGSVGILVGSLFAFYSGHCILSPILPVAVSRYPEQSARGTVMSVFTMYQFLGAGIGGIAGGFLAGYSHSCLFSVLCALTLCAMIAMAGFGNFQFHTACDRGCTGE